MGAITAPTLSLAALAPFLFVFGAAAVGVLVEAFAPRDTRHPVQVAVALVGTLGGLVSAVLLAGKREVTAGGALAVDGPALFLEATITGLGALAILLFAERALDPARSSFVTVSSSEIVQPAAANSGTNGTSIETISTLESLAPATVTNLS